MISRKQFESWCESLKRGDLVPAFNPSSRKYSHVIEYAGRKTKETSRDGSESFLLVRGSALCGVEGNGWFWTVSQSDHGIPDEDDCPRCYSRVKAVGTEIRNYPKERAAGQKDTDPLPFGWKSFVPSSTGRKVKWNYDKDIYTFSEVKVWRRGPRTVKIGQVTAHTGPDERVWPFLVATRWESEGHDSRYMCSSMEQALKFSFDLMAKGGY